MFSRKAQGPPPPDYLPPQREARPKEVTITINRRQFTVPSEWTILKACRENGIFVPTLCHHPLLQATGRCGVCVVHVEGRAQPMVQSCKTLVEPGMTVTTNTPEVQYQSQVNLREFLGTRPLESLPPTHEIEELVRFVRNGAVVPEQNQQYAIVRDQALCISCTRCVRVCSGVQNMGILSIDPDRPLQPISFEGDLPLHATSCIACGQCTVVCPTGAVRERSDVALVLAELEKTGDERKTIILQTAPAGRLSLGEILGNEEPGECKSPAKTVAAAHAAGFDLVFDTTFAADTCATLEAEELVERIRQNGPFPMFTSCCPGWVKLVENKFPHLRPLLSRCKSPMMMLGAMIRSWMETRGVARNKYFVVAMMPCTAKKEEITRPELRDPHGNKDVNVVLTVREFADLMRKRGVADWAALPGEHKAEYDGPFGVSSGGGALFGTTGGVTEAAMRVAYTIFTKELPADPSRKLFEECRRMAASGEWVDAQVDITPGRKHRRPIESLVINGARSIQQFLEDSGLEVSLENFTRRGSKIFIECMACPGGCIGGGGQPASLDEHAVMKRRRAIHQIDAKSENISPIGAQGEFQRETLQGITSAKARELLEYEPPIFFVKTPRSTRHKPKLPASSSTSPTASRTASRSHGSGGPGSSSRSGTSPHPSTLSSSSAVGDVAIIYGSQSGFTATFAKNLFSFLNRNIAEELSIHPMDHFNLEKLATTRTIILLTSTWESDEGLMPQNARHFFHFMRSQPLTALNSMLLGTKFAVCGFGSSKYPRFCGFAIQLHDIMLRLGSQPFADLLKIDVERADKGKKPFLQWSRKIAASLQNTGLPNPGYLLVPSITPGGKSSAKACAPGFQFVTISKVMEYKDVAKDAGKFHYVEFDTGRLYIDPQPDQYLYVLPCNHRSDVESCVNTIYPGMLNTSVSLIPTNSHGSSSSSLLPPHLTVRHLFEQFIDLSRRPSLWFVQQMESLVEETESSMRDIILDPAAYANWVKDKTYFQVLKQYKAVIPPIEILISMLPLMLPRCYTPMHQDSARPHTLGIVVKTIEGGLCSKFLTNSKKGDKIMVTLGTSDFQRPNDAFAIALRPRHKGKEAAHHHQDAPASASASASASKHTASSSSAAADAPIPLAPMSRTVSQMSTSSSASAGPTVELSAFPLLLSVHRLFGHDRRLPVDEPLQQTFEITNLQKEKYRFTLTPIDNDKLTLTFEPTSGVLKPKFAVSMRAHLVVHCTTNVDAKIHVTCEAVGKHTDEASTAVSTYLPLVFETKLSPKLDFDELKLSQEIGHGTFGIVYRGEWRGQEVAIKVLHPRAGSEKADHNDFKNECQVLQELRCQYTVNFIGFSVSQGRKCLITEFMPLGSLARFVRTDKLSNELKIRIALDTAKGISFLHHCGLIHRDIKPGNILMVSLDPQQMVVCKIADFGTSKETASPEEMKMMTQGVGTPIYMAPEVLDGHPYTTSADVFSFAITLWEIFSPVAPYSTPDFSVSWRISQFVSEGKRLPIPNGMPGVLSNIVQACWLQDPKSRLSFDTIVSMLSNSFEHNPGAPGSADGHSSDSEKPVAQKKDKKKEKKKHHKKKGAPSPSQ